MNNELTATPSSCGYAASVKTTTTLSVCPARRSHQVAQIASPGNASVAANVVVAVMTVLQIHTATPPTLLGLLLIIVAPPTKHKSALTSFVHFVTNCLMKVCVSDSDRVITLLPY